MIQRKQTIFLILAIIFLSQLFIFPVYSFKGKDEKFEMLIQGTRRFFPGGETLIEANSGVFPLVGLTAGSIFLLAAIIFLYKKRPVQMKLCKLAILLIAGLVVAIFYFADSLRSLPEFEGYAADIKPGLVFPIAALLMVIMANRFIKKDEDLVRSADRLR